MGDRNDLKPVLIKTLLFFLIAIAAYALLFLTAGRFLKEVSRYLAGNKGLFGSFLFVYIVDTLIVPATPDLVFTVSSASPLILLPIVCTASILGGFTGYLIGRYLNHLPVVRKLVSYYSKKGETLINRYGVWAVALAGFTPIPYSTVSWISGMFKIKPGYYLLASLTRIPRLTLYYFAIHEGIHLFS